MEKKNFITRRAIPCAVSVPWRRLMTHFCRTDLKNGGFLGTLLSALVNYAYICIHKKITVTSHSAATLKRKLQKTNITKK
ncbi:MAG: hypothetical protein PUD91_04125 [Bacteroidales bacterium]|nr:hypothetical protein [Bacteroidales bacterium]